MNPKRSTVSLLLILAATLLALPLAAGFLGRIHPALDSFAHFRAHLAVLLALVALAALLAWERLVGAIALIFAAAAFLTTTGWLDQNRVPLQPTGGPAAIYTLLQLNLFDENPHPERALSLIGRLMPDVITLEEVENGWPERLALLKQSYPYMQICEAADVAILSRRPFAAGDAPFCLDHFRMAVARIDFGGADVDIAAVHLLWPWPFPQPRQIEELRPTLALLSDTAMLAGDFNAATWSAAVARVAEEGGLKPLEGVRPSWMPKQLPDVLRRHVGLPIDQVLAKGRIVLRSVETADDAGSDHLPVLVRFSIEPAAQDGASVQVLAPAIATPG